MQLVQQDAKPKTDLVFSIVVEAMHEIMDFSGQSAKAVTDETPLYGGDGEMDSLSLVLLVSAIEEAVRDHLKVDVLLASERAMSMRHSPYRTVGTLVRFIEDELAAA
ncbi:MAG: hypothetical protein ACRYFW_08350 [Janthinobacterium lividum]